MSGVILNTAKTLELTNDLSMAVHLVCVNCSIAFLPGAAGVGAVCVCITRKIITL